MRHPLIPGCAVALAAAALLAGCGSSKSTTSTATNAPAAATTPATTSAASSTQPSGGVLIVTKPSRLGTIIAAGPKHLTAYMFAADSGGASACTGACATAWPPVTTSGAPHAVGSVVAASLGTITRSDGTTQVTYKGHPLYFFEKDGDSGDAYGQDVNAFGASWYALGADGDQAGGGGSSQYPTTTSSSSGHAGSY